MVVATAVMGKPWGGFCPQVQRKVLAEPGPVLVRDAQGRIVLGPDGQP